MMMTPDVLKEKVIEEFDSASLLKCLELDASLFREIPRLFEVGHLSMRVVLNDQSALAAASNIAAKLKRDLQLRGVELDYVIAVRWVVASFSEDWLQYGKSGNSIPPESFQVELQSGEARRLASVYISPEANRALLRYLRYVPYPDQPNALAGLLETCINRQLAGTGLEHWDPVLYPTRTVQDQEIVDAIAAQQESLFEK